MTVKSATVYFEVWGPKKCVRVWKVTQWTMLQCS